MKDIEPLFCKKVHVANSFLSGKGLFSDELIKKGEVILRFGGSIALQKDRHSGSYIESSFLPISEDCILCETKTSQKDPSDYINHSCSPNVGMKDCITLIAIRDIQIGEEILCDYAFWECDEDYVMKEQCKCGYVNCRHIITGKDWRKFSKEDKLFRYFSPFIKRRILNNN